MADRRELVKRMTDLFGKGYFQYASYTGKPDKLPHSLYIETPRKQIKADGKTWVKVRTLIIRVVSAYKDWDLEDEVENIFDDLELPYQKITDEPFADEKVHVVEWQIEVIG